MRSPTWQLAKRYGMPAPVENSGSAGLVRQAGHGFTLVELLVVIGIISVLIAILLPALNKAREAAGSVVCLSNQRQLGMVMAMYANENQGWLPPDVALEGGRWPALLVRKGYINTPMAPTTSSAVLEGVFSCPAETAARTRANTVWYQTNYGLSWYFFRNWYGHNNYRQGRLFPFGFQQGSGTTPETYTLIFRPVKDPTGTVLLGDSGLTSSGSSFGTLLVMPNKINFRHGKYWNILYYDFHVESRSDLPDDATAFWRGQGGPGQTK